MYLCNDDNDKLITVVKYLLNLNTAESNFVMLKGFPNGSPAEVSKPDSNELVFNNIEITPTDGNAVTSGGDMDQIAPGYTYNEVDIVLNYLVSNNVQKDALWDDAGVKNIATAHFNGDMSMVERIDVDADGVINVQKLTEMAIWQEYLDSKK